MSMATEKVVQMDICEKETQSTGQKEKGYCCYCLEVLLIFVILLSIDLIFFLPITDIPDSKSNIVSNDNCPSRPKILVQPNSTIKVDEFGFVVFHERKSDGESHHGLPPVTTKEQFMQLETLVVDCPVKDSGDNFNAKKELADHLEIIRAYTKENNHTAALKVWLRLSAEEERDFSYQLSPCTQLAVFGKMHFPEIVEGIIGSNELFRFPLEGNWFESGDEKDMTINLQNAMNISSYLEAYPLKITGFHFAYLKFAFMMDPKDCFIFPTITPESIISEFDGLFYYFKEGCTYYTFTNNTPVAVSWSNFDECRDFVAAKAPNAPDVTRINSAAYMTYADFLRIFSNDESKQSE